MRLILKPRSISTTRPTPLGDVLQIIVSIKRLYISRHIAHGHIRIDAEWWQLHLPRLRFDYSILVGDWVEHFGRGLVEVLLVIVLGLGVSVAESSVYRHWSFFSHVLLFLLRHLQFLIVECICFFDTY